MNIQKRTGLFLVGGLLAAACGGGNDDDTDAGTTVTLPGSLTTLSEIEPGDTCEAGGTLIETGVDNNENGTLDSDEIEDSVNVCSGVNGTATDGTEGADGNDGDAGDDGVVTLSSVSSADLSSCPAGGTVVAFGPDADGSGTLEAEEVDSTFTVCNGPAGEGVCAPVVKVTPIAAGSVCAAGGVLVEYGQDTGAASGAGGAGGAGGASDGVACDGLLSVDEVLGSEPVCNGIQGEKGDTGEKGDMGETGDTGEMGDTGSPGTDGSDGANMAVSLTFVDAGVTCASGGLQIDSGVDDNNDGVLQGGEIDDSAVSCF